VTAAGVVLGVLTCFVFVDRGLGFKLSKNYYLAALVVSGAIASLISPKWFLLSGVGVFIGQAAYKALYMPDGLFGDFEYVIIGALSTMSIAGGGIVYLVNRQTEQGGSGRVRMKYIGSALVLLAGMILGAAIWNASPSFTGMIEPWDAKGIYYPLALFLAGALASLPSPRRYWLAPVGIFVGQAWLLHRYLQVELSAFGPMGLIFAAGYSFLSLPGGWCVHRIIRAVQEGRERK
jgi:hypothetical protein